MDCCISTCHLADGSAVVIVVMVTVVMVIVLMVIVMMVTVVIVLVPSAAIPLPWLGVLVHLLSASPPATHTMTTPTNTSQPHLPHVWHQLLLVRLL